ncbi:hypothetical protein HQN60_15495 [Deefgea piscis]|uniref:Uncharacterized protein n=1 Tax=Deefgea piscis TaxID=2739061 RepID=A0A6M8STJ8_9NEIS|nr:hypothetical protein [Deefgea piscis]QKJ68011.1 hypothetical protein HQN60_15495 [Deefgea piscis]
MPQEKLGNNQTSPLLAESFSIIKLQARADEWIFRYHGGGVRSRFERLCVLSGTSGLSFHELRHEGISGLFEERRDSRSGFGIGATGRIWQGIHS